MKTTIVCGLLGAGKTSFIQHYVKTVSGKTVVLVNDFGKAGIDGEIFSADGVDSIELPSGCVCCTLKFDLITTVEKIRDTLSPDNFLIEPSGVASPSGVLEVLEILKISPVTVVGIVDATEFIELHESRMYGSFFEDQIVNSDIVLVNKVDIVGEELILRTVRTIEEMNAAAIIFRTIKADVKGFFPAVSGSQRFLNRETPHFQLDTVSLKLGGQGKFSVYEAFFRDMAKETYGRVIRAKGLFQTDKGPFRFDLSFGKMDSSPFERPVTDNRLVVIGEDLKKDVITEKLTTLLSSQPTVL